MASRALSFAPARVELVNLSASGAVPEGPPVQEEGRISYTAIIESP